MNVEHCGAGVSKLYIEALNCYKDNGLPVVNCKAQVSGHNTQAVICSYTRFVSLLSVTIAERLEWRDLYNLWSNLSSYLAD